MPRSAQARVRMPASLLLTFCAALALASGCAPGNSSRAQAQGWRFADSSSAGLAPSPEAEPAAIVQVYAARTYSWRGYFAVHSWVATKEKGAASYVTYHVIGWRARGGGSVVVEREDEPDRRWYGAEPELLEEIRGERAERAIAKVREAVASYPYPNEYRAWPGPNSNTFVSHILRNVPELGVELPPHAIGKDWIGAGDLAGFTESKTGVQLSLFGLLGFQIGLAEGLEFNLLGLNLGFDLARPALKLPLVGRVGFRDEALFVD